MLQQSQHNSFKTAMADPSTHFFKFITPGFKFDLSLPSSFLTQLNCGRCSKATLSRGRHEWSVDIDDGVFGDGWRRFVRENGVQEFDFIVFKHKGGMMFEFLVFDQSTCERQYPNISDEMEVEEPPTVSDTIRTIMKGPKNLKKHKRNDYASQDQKFQVKKETGSTMKKATSSTLKDYPYFISTLKPCCFKKLFLQLPLHFYETKSFENWRYDSSDAFKFEIIEKEKNKPPVVSFSCLTPIEEDGHRYFIGILKSYNLQKPYLYLPQEFVTFNGLINKKIMILKNAEDERLWTVELRNYRGAII
ncbi:unnamed protein product [Lactuca saligna]|uniref:TF-B3 domain-containing protein n=1 Tax=Lactuca saligna TaxID=75948 RepID=A0AA35YP79_LACSI|nr:unnamed protein product [Lactuca saligna]